MILFCRRELGSRLNSEARELAGTAATQGGRHVTECAWT